MSGNLTYIKDACGLAQAKGLPSLIHHEPAIEVRFVRGAAGPTSFLTKRDRRLTLYRSSVGGLEEPSKDRSMD
jgi:hypothetical protein